MDCKNYKITKKAIFLCELKKLIYNPLRGNYLLHLHFKRYNCIAIIVEIQLVFYISAFRNSISNLPSSRNFPTYVISMQTQLADTFTIKCLQLHTC